MPITLAIDSGKRIVYSALHGAVDDEQIARHIQLIKSHPNFQPAFADIIDCQGVTEASVAESTLRDLASRQSIFSTEAMHIVIAPKGHLARLAEMYKAAAESTRPNFQIVRTPEEAYEYLRQRRGDRQG